jgi:hypothetical protein
LKENSDITITATAEALNEPKVLVTNSGAPVITVLYQVCAKMTPSINNQIRSSKGL